MEKGGYENHASHQRNFAHQHLSRMSTNSEGAYPGPHQGVRRQKPPGQASTHGGRSLSRKGARMVAILGGWTPNFGHFAGTPEEGIGDGPR